MSKGKFNTTNGHYYEYYSNEKTWESAFNSATGKTWNGVDGYLLEVENKSENSFVNHFVTKDLQKNRSVWINLNDVVKEGDFRYLGGEKDGQKFLIQIGIIYILGILYW